MYVTFLQPLHFVSVPGVSKATEEANRETLKRRLETVAQVRESVDVTLQQEVKALSRQKRLEGLDLPIQVSAKNVLAMKSCLSLSWNTMRKLRL